MENYKAAPQVGGTHYKSQFEPICLIEELHLNFSEGNVVKYVTRYPKKNGLEDLQKALWYIKRLEENPNERRRLFAEDEELVLMYNSVNELDSDQSAAIRLLFSKNYELAKERILEMINNFNN